jgi:hypothetical protein
MALVSLLSLKRRDHSEDTDIERRIIIGTYGRKLYTGCM